VSALWTAAEASAATGGQGDRDWAATGVSIDSRSIAPGDLFIALAGPQFDGHEFVAAALAKGAAAALVARRPDGVAADAPLLVVEDTLAALGDLGRAARRRSHAQIIGVTGSVGKTGTKEALRQALATQGASYASAASLNNHWGVPLSLARMPLDTRFAVLEIGMNHPGEIDPLSRMAAPDVAIITTIEPAHLGFFPSVEAIADAKAEIFNGMTSGGAAVLNRDNPHFARLAAAARGHGITRILGFGEHAEATIRLAACRVEPEGSDVTAIIDGETLRYRVALPGRHHAMNSLAVLGAVLAVGGDLAAAAAALAGLQPLDGRGRRHPLTVAGGTALLIDESYNASPAAMRAAFAVLATAAPAPGGRRIAVLGDMRELGDAAPQLHAELASPLLAAGVDLVFTVGPHMERLAAVLPPALRAAHTATAREMTPLLRQRLRPGDIVMVKGSLGTRMADIVKPLLAAAPEAVGA
jgi:UDP-N-acetylmuramoyl-tripeptide--D-alanyl-D-alanine ligase